MTRTIDLGLVGTDRRGGDPAPPPRRWLPRRGRWLPRRDRPSWTAGRAWHWWPAAALAAGLLLASGPAAVLEPDPFRQLFAVPPGSTAIPTETHLYVLDADTLQASDGVLTAYRLRDGAPAWRRDVTQATGFNVLADTPLVTTVELPASDVPARGDPPESTHTVTALDPHTGEVRWTKDGTPAGEAAGRVLVAGSRPAGNVEYRFPLWAIDPTTGRTEWHTTVPFFRARNGERLVAIHPDGELAVYDLAVGERTARRQVEIASGQDGWPHLAPTIVGSRVLVTGPGRLTAYDADTLAHQWTAQVPAPAPLSRCGQVVCLAGPERVHSLDPDSGHAAWPPLSPGPTESQRWSVRDLRDGRHFLVAASSPGASSTIVDAEAGRPVRTLTGWRAVRPPVEPGMPRRTGAAVLVRSAAGVGNSWVARLDPHTLEPAVLGTIRDPAPVWCTTRPDRLLCHVDAGEGRRIQVWRTPHGPAGQ